MANLEDDERHVFFKSSAALYGDKLKAKVTETHFHSRHRKSVLQFSTKGDFEFLAEVEERYKDKPDQLAEMKQNSMLVPHPTSKEMMIWMPIVSLEAST
eukprot:2999575-Karenia_brevis.AAC.1